MWKLPIFLIICYIGGKTLAETNDFRCDYEFQSSIDGWLKLHEIPATWHEARLRCTLEGTVLASPLDNRLRRAMQSMIKLHEPSIRKVFTGIHATFSRGDYFSIEGVPLWRIPHRWASSQSANLNNDESCLSMDLEGSVSIEKCSNTFNYICHKKRTPDMVVNNCGTTDPAYVRYDRTNMCYKFHREPRTWSRAYMTCAAEGGYLVIINSDKEAGIIREIFADNPASTIEAKVWKSVAFVGFHDWDEHGTWLTVHGQTLKEAGYSKFSPGEPNNSTSGEFCGAVYRTALFDDLWCENPYAFICEKDPESLLCPTT